MTRRTIAKPLGLSATTYFRIRVTDPSGRSQLHNQPFATRDIARAAAETMRARIARNSRFSLPSWKVEIVEVTSR